MAFDEIRLPLCVGYGSSGGPFFMTDVITLQGGYEKRNQNWLQPRRKFDAMSGVHSHADVVVLAAFFQARFGKARGFRLKDWADFTSAQDGISAPSYNDQVIGAGDGVQTEFQLIKNYTGGSVRDIKKPVADSVLVSVDDVQYMSEWSVNEQTGVVTFAQAPAKGSIVKAGYEFDVPVRFDTDQLSITSINDGVSQLDQEVPLIEVRV